MADAKNTKTTDKTLAQINRELEEKVTRQRAKDLNLPYVEIGIFPINPDILYLVPEKEARAAMAMPFFKIGKKLKIAAFDLNKLETQALLNALKEKDYIPQVHIASANGLEEAFRSYSSEQYKFKAEAKNIVKEEEIHFEKELENLAGLKGGIINLPAEEALNLLHVSAIKAGASDIHYQPEEAGCLLRFRIDGVLHPLFEVSKELYARLANQLKYKADMKLNITNVPQDGRFSFIINARKIDVRVSVLPTEYGESFVCRILDTGKRFDSFEELGFREKSLEILNKASKLAHGMVLVTGPTSSGKTTTLYMLLKHFNKPELKIISLEDPIEYHLEGITQSQVNEKRGYTFATGLRSILRQDPDVVMIGEIRDLETAQASAQAALTGHVVLSTLHTNSAVESIPRLITIGAPNFLIAPALSVIIAQRLVRRLCTCSTEKPLAEQEKEVLVKVTKEIPKKVKQAKGCENCSYTGYRGQMVVSEVIEVDDEIKEAILKNKSTREISELARKKGMLTMAEDALLKVAAGFTTFEEIYRVINA